jgi:hypothetical protein
MQEKYVLLHQQLLEFYKGLIISGAGKARD